MLLFYAVPDSVFVIIMCRRPCDSSMCIKNKAGRHGNEGNLFCYSYIPHTPTCVQA